MRKTKALLVQIIVILSVIASSLWIPLTAQSTPVTAEQAANSQPQPMVMQPLEAHQVSLEEGPPPSEVVQNADPYLMSLALGHTQPTSRYGPSRNNPDEGIPRYAYSPFQEPEKREVCPPGGCDYIADQLLIKFEPDPLLRDAGPRGVMPLEASLSAAMEEFEILSLTPIFPDAEKPQPGQRIATPDGDLIPAPDLTLWYRAETRSTETLGVIAQSLAANESVAWVEPDFVRRPLGIPHVETQTAASADQVAPLSLPGSGSDPLFDQQWHLEAANVVDAWAYLESQGLPPGGSRDIVVAVIDTGVDYTHPDLAANMWINSAEYYGTPGVDDDGNGYIDDIFGVNTVTGSGDPMDDHGHGTHVAGIIAAQANNEIGGVGVAYNVQIMAIKAAQYSGVLSASDIAEGIYYAVSKGADVINMSFGGYARSQVEEDALAVAFGTAVLVAAAGNDGRSNDFRCFFGAPMYPAAHNWVLGVMASNSNDNHALFSNWDCIPRDEKEYELMAPGEGVWSTLPGEQYAAWSGTSMAAPVVSGIAALARTQWSNKDVYSSRFIMGQIASNTSGGIGGVADALTALTVPPTPSLSYLQHWVFDTPDLSDINDNDGIVDAGETVDLAIVIRNHWGKAENVTVTLEALAEGAFQPDPYVDMIIDTVNYGAVGSFNWKDNGLIYDAEGTITGVEFPFRFSTDPNTPNDHVIPFKLTITASNGYDPDDLKVYTAESRFFLLVQRGIELPRIISEDMTLSKDFYWLVSDSVLIAEGATVTVTEGTQIQFFSADPDNPYSQAPRPYLQVEGTLNVQGSAEEPVEIFTGLLWQGYPIQILQIPGGSVTLRFVRMTNPVIGDGQDIYTYNWVGQPLDLVENSYFTQDLLFCIMTYRYWEIPPSWANLCGTAVNTPPRTTSSIINNSIFYKLGVPRKHLVISDSISVNSNLFDTNFLSIHAPADSNVFLKNHIVDKWGNYHPSKASTGRLNDSLDNDFSNNAILNFWWDPDINKWMRFFVNTERNNVRHIENNYWGTTSTTLIDATIHDFYNDVNLGIYQYEPILTTAPETAYPFVVDVVLATSSYPDATVVGAEPVTFTVSFNRDMDTAIQPMVTFGPDIPMTDYTVHPINGGWQDARTWAGSFNITPVTGDGYHLIRVTGAVAADDPWLVTGNDAGRFRFRVETSGTAAMNLQASGGEGYVDLSWTQTDFDLLAGFNLYRATSLDGEFIPINTNLIPPETREFRDTDVIPGQPYYYKFTVVQTDMSESDFSNTATATPIDTIPPEISHTPVTSAPPGLALTLNADVTDNVAVHSVTLFYRAIGAETYDQRVMTHTTNDRYSATLEGSLMVSPGIEYYIEASDGISITRSGRAENPHSVSVDDRPVVTIVTPNTGPAEGGTAVSIMGSNFKPGATVTFGGMAASNVTVVSSNQITATTPAHFPNTVDVRVNNPDDQFGVLLNGFTFVSTTAQVSLPDTGGGTGNVVSVPVNAANIQGMVAASLTINYNPAVLTARSASTGTLTPGWAFTSNLYTLGEVRLSMVSPGGSVSGSGTLAKIEFEVVGDPGSSSLLTVSTIALNDGAIPVELSDGVFNIDDVYNVSGTVAFWHAGQPVSAAKLTLSGDRVYHAYSGLDGQYTIQGAAIGSYILAPSKDGGAGDAISAYDASFVLQHDVGIITLSGHQAIAADVNNNGHITAMDAYYILQKAAGLISLPFPGAGVTWKFDPVQRSIADLNQYITGQNFTAILLGDVSGNWTDPGEAEPDSHIAVRDTSATLTIPEATALPSTTKDVPIMLSMTDAELFGADLTFTYDPDHVTISEVRLGSLASGWSIASNLNEPGTVRIALAGATPIITSGELVTFTLTTLDEAGTQSDLVLIRGDLNEGGIPSTLNSGSIYIAIPVLSGFSANPTSGNAPLEVAFSNQSTGDWTASSWHFGDGSTSTADNPTHTYTTPGTYTVSLTVSGPGGSATETKTEHIQVDTISVSGQVLYWYEGKAVPGTLSTLEGVSTHSDTTDESGAFNISGITGGAYTLTPTKENDIHGITAYDAALVLKHSAGLEQLDGYAALAADVSKNGGISALDASLILQKSVGLIDSFPDADSMWLFDPASYDYPNLTESLTDQDFIAILLGDPSGNWGNEEAAQNMAAREISASLSVQSLTIPPGEEHDVAIELSISTGELLGTDIILTYDHSVLEITDVRLGALTAGWTMAVNPEKPGAIRLAIANDRPLSESGELLVLTVKAIGEGTETEIAFTRGDLNEGSIGTELHSGTIQIPGPQDDPTHKIYLPLILR